MPDLDQTSFTFVSVFLLLLLLHAPALGLVSKTSAQGCNTIRLVASNPRHGHVHGPRSANNLGTLNQQDLFSSLWRAPLVWLMLNVLRFLIIAAFKCAALLNPKP